MINFFIFAGILKYSGHENRRWRTPIRLCNARLGYFRVRYNSPQVHVVSLKKYRVLKKCVSKITSSEQALIFFELSINSDFVFSAKNGFVYRDRQRQRPFHTTWDSSDAVRFRRT